MGAKTTPVHFESLEVGDEYLSSLSIIPKKSTELMQLRDRVMDHLKANSIRAMSSSFPHMSLFYLDESFKGERLLLSKQLRETGRVHEQRGGETNFTLNCTVDGAGPEFDAMKGFEGTEIWLVDCTEGVEDWTVLDRRDLKPRMPKPKVRSEKWRLIFRDGANPDILVYTDQWHHIIPWTQDIIRIITHNGMTRGYEAVCIQVRIGGICTPIGGIHTPIGGIISPT